MTAPAEAVRIFLLACLLGAGLGLYFGFLRPLSERHPCWADVLFVPVLFCYIARLSWFRKLRIKHDISYGIYLYGWPVQQFILFLFPGIGYYAYMFLSMLIATLFAYISFVWIEKPFMNIGKKVNRLLQ